MDMSAFEFGCSLSSRLYVLKKVVMFVSVLAFATMAWHVVGTAFEPLITKGSVVVTVAVVGVVPVIGAKLLSVPVEAIF